jgi:hypothetical protein
MKIFCITFITLIFFNSCQQNKNDLKNLKNELKVTGENYEKLELEIDEIKNNYLKPFEMFEKSVLEEKNKRPDSSIREYKKIIEMFPNSYWSHESKRRIENINNRKHLWSEEEGWNLLNIKPTKDIETILCPGC